MGMLLAILLAMLLATLPAMVLAAQGSTMKEVNLAADPEAGPEVKPLQT